MGVGLGEGWVRVGVWVRKWVGGKVTGGWRLEKEKMASKGGWRGLEPLRTGLEHGDGFRV